MARELLMAGDEVLITSRSLPSLEDAMQDLQHECGERSKVGCMKCMCVWFCLCLLMEFGETCHCCLVLQQLPCMCG